MGPEEMMGMELDEIARMGKGKEGKEGKEGSPRKGAGKKQRAIDQGKCKTGLCKFFEEGKCLRGEDCTFGHSSDELKLPKLPLQGARVRVRARVRPRA